MLLNCFTNEPTNKRNLATSFNSNHECDIGVLLETLASTTEPAIEFRILFKLSIIPNYKDYSNEQITCLLRNILDIFTKTPNAKLKLLSLKLLSAVDAKNRSISSNVISLIFKTILLELLRVFPNDLDSTDSQFFHASTYTSPQTFKLRIYLLHSISSFLHADSASNSDFVTFINKLLIRLLDPNVNPYLQAAAINLINNLPPTNKNRERVESLFRSPIAELGLKLSKEIIDALSLTIGKFNSIWYLKTSDRTLLSIKTSTNFPNQGYSFRQKELLHKRQINEGKNLIENMENKLCCISSNNTSSNDKYLELFAVPIFSTKIQPLNICDNLIDNTEEDEDDLKDLNCLTFNTESTIIFKRYPFEEIIYLQNKSYSKSCKFSIQADPHQCFRVFPSQGILKNGESIPIKIKFSSYFCDKSSEIKGFLRLRNDRGFQIERINLLGFLGHPIKVIPREINFGVCCYGQSRKATIKVQNLFNVEISVMAALKNSVSNINFKIKQTLLNLKPFETKDFLITFEPDEAVEDVSTNVILIALGSIYNVILSGSCNAFFSILEKSIDFGNLDIYYDGYVKKILITNHSNQKLPLGCISSSNELIINEGYPLVLEPKSAILVPVRFLPTMPGHRKESISFYSPFCEPQQISAIAFSGPMILLPVLEDIFFPVALPNFHSTTRFPITNLFSKAVEFSVSLPLGSPFTLRIVDYEKLKKIPSTSQQIDLKLSEVDEKSTLIISLGPLFTCIIEVTFHPAIYQCIRVKVNLELINPRKMYIGYLYLNGIGLDEGSFMGLCERRMDIERKFSRIPSRLPEYISSRENISSGLSSPRIAFSSLVFQLDPSLQIIYGKFLGQKLGTEVFEFITLTNVTDQPQVYHIVLSQYFVADIPFDGILGPSGVLRIPLRLNDYFFTQGVGINRENEAFSAMGAITVFDENQEAFGFVTAQVHGIMGNLLDLELRSNTDFIKFPSTMEVENQYRQLFIRNRTPKDVLWEGIIGPLSCKTFTRSTPASEICPFTLSSSRINLKPFEYLAVDIQFFSPTPGKFQSKVLMQYRDIVEHIGKIEKSALVDRSWPLNSLIIECAVGASNLQISNADINFGEVILSSSAKQPVDFVNQSKVNNPYIMENSTCFLWKDSYLQVELELQEMISFYPTGCKVFQKCIALGDLNQSLSINCLGVGGKYGLSTDIGTLQSKEDLNFRVFNIGNLGLGKKLSKLLQIQNTGTLDILIEDIFIENPAILKYQFTDVFKSPKTYVNFGTESSEALEIDWDELDYSKLSKKRAQSPKEIGKNLHFDDFEPNLDSNYEFPIKIPAGSNLDVNLTFSGSKIGDQLANIIIKTKKNEILDELIFRSKANIQPILKASDTIVDFGIRAVKSHHKMSIQFSNNGSEPLNWDISKLKVIYLDVNSTSNPRNKESSPFYIFPSSGVLLPNCTQNIVIIFAPSIANVEIVSKWKLCTAGFGDSDFYIRGISASSKLVVETRQIDFGTLRVNSRKIFNIVLQNQGIMASKFFVEANNQIYSAEPEEGMIEGLKSIDIAISFEPRNTGDFEAQLLISQYSNDIFNYDAIVISMKGAASYPEVSVITKVVDFGTALFMQLNTKMIMIENRGAADGELIFSCDHPDIKLEKSATQQDNILKGGCIQEFPLTYFPQKVEELNSKIIIKSSDNRGFESIVLLKGYVGIPKVKYYPENVLDGVDFKVCEVSSISTRTITLINDGNIVLNYEITIKMIKEQEVLIYEEYKEEKTHPAQPVFTVDPFLGTIPVGESQNITISFAPAKLLQYSYEMVLNYEFQTYKIPLSGVGGQSILRIDTPLRIIDFGICRIQKNFKRTLRIRNIGNRGFNYRVRPEPSDKNWAKYDIENLEEDTEIKSKKYSQWIKELAADNFKLYTYDGYCDAYGYSDFSIDYIPTSETISNSHLRIIGDNDFKDIILQGRGAYPKLVIYDAASKQKISKSDKATINIGVHPVNSLYSHVVQLVNEGAFGLDYFVQPMVLSEFDVMPCRGFIEPYDSMPLNIRFKPSSENDFSGLLKLIWEQETLVTKIIGKGGKGKLGLYFSPNDSQERGLDFGMIPLTSTVEKRFILNNDGMVAMFIVVELLHDNFSLCQSSQPIQIQQLKNQFDLGNIDAKKNTQSWSSSVRIKLDPNMGVEVAVRYMANTAAHVNANMIIKTEFDKLGILVKGKGGTINIDHRGDLYFGDIACNHTYTRKIFISNSGSISCKLRAEISIVGHTPGEGSSPSNFKLTEIYTALDPRSGWARQYLCRNKNSSDTNIKLTSKEYWKLIALLIRKCLSREEIGTGGLSKKSTTSMNQLSSHYRLNAGGASKRSANTGSSSHFKRRQMFYHLITTNLVTSQSSSRTRPFVRVEPSVLTLPSAGEVSVVVSMHLSTENALLGTLVVISDISNTPPHEIPLTAGPKAVNILCNDTRTLNFYRQALGSSEIIERSFSNIGHKDINFKFINPNSSLVIAPSRGSLKIGQKLSVQFLFKPVDESIQSADVIFEPDCSQPIRLKMYGGGGYSKASLSRYRRFDFGHCMIGKDTFSHMPISNEGNAILHLTKFDLIETDTFFRGKDWPNTRISLFPGKVYNLPIMFNPHEESPLPGRLIVGSNMETWEIELVGLGREAVLIVSKVALEFSECLIGNSYEQKLGLKNIGEVNYPVSFKLEKDFPDLEFRPAAMSISPFTENFVTITYNPSKETKMTIILTILSPYSSHKIPLLLHAGTAILDFSSMTLDFGLFERTTKPELILSFRNVGTVRTSYSIKDLAKPSMFYVPQPKGILNPGKSADVVVSHVKHEVEQFEEKIIVKTDLVDKIYTIKARGQCEETILHSEEFSLLNLGICPVLEATSKPLVFTNYGNFPLQYNIKAAYPIKVVPSTGTVAGKGTETVEVTWIPSGGYELRTQISMVTNIGTYSIVIRGKAASPDIFVDSNLLDYGVCGTGFLYIKTFNISNRGKVPLKFSIPILKEKCYYTTVKEGMLMPKEIKTVEVMFRPEALGKITSNLMIESKGLHYKEILLSGIGGILKLNIQPSILDLGRCPFNLAMNYPVMLSNNGDVTLEIQFKENISKSKSKIEEIGCSCILPGEKKILPGKTIKCFLSFTALVVGQFETSIAIVTKENAFLLPVNGNGIKIKLSLRSQQILQTEKLKILNPYELNLLFKQKEDLDFHLKRFSAVYKIEHQIAETISVLYTQLKSKSQESVYEEFIFDDSNEKTERIVSMTRKQGLELLETIRVSKEISGKDIDLVLAKFLSFRNGKILEVSKEPIIEGVIEYGRFKVENVSLDNIICHVHPDLDVNIDILLARPSAFIGVEKIDSKKSNLKRYMNFPNLDRRLRNARTVDFFSK